MMIRMLRDSESLDVVADELLFTEARLKSDEVAKQFAAAVSDLLARIDQSRAGQIDARREEVSAQAAVAAADDQLDDWIRGLDRVLTDVVHGNTESPRYKRYFASAPWTFIRLGLESEISRVRSWSDSLASEPEQSLKDFAANLGSIVTQGEAALERRRKAAGSRSDHRVRSIASLVEEVNATRAALYGNLAMKAAEAGLPADWPGRFFKRSARRKDEPAAPPAAS